MLFKAPQTEGPSPEKHRHRLAKCTPSGCSYCSLTLLFTLMCWPHSIVCLQVSALLVGDGHLSVLGRITGLTDLVLQGRMCSASDTGLLALSGLTKLNSLAISWVPWQSQITQVGTTGGCGDGGLQPSC